MNDAAIDMSDPAMVTVRRLKLPLVVLLWAKLLWAVLLWVAHYLLRLR